MSATALYVGVNGLAQKVFDSSDFGNLFDSAIDENNKLYSSPSITNFRDTPASYTATEDCYVYMSYWGSVGTNMYPKLNGKLLGPGSLQGNKAMILLPIKKGDVISHRHESTINESCFVQFEVYGRKPAAVSHDYSTTEQIVGTWINGKTLYEKSMVVTITNGTQWVDTGIDSTCNITHVEGVLTETGGNSVCIPSPDPQEQIGFNVSAVGVVTSGKWSVLFRTTNTDARGGLVATFQYTKSS